MSLDYFKNELEAALMITTWSPTEHQLKEIAKKIKEFKGEPTTANIAKLVLEVVGSYESISMQGIDNSDLTTLLLLATKTVPSND